MWDIQILALMETDNTDSDAVMQAGNPSAYRDVR